MAARFSTASVMTVRSQCRASALTKKCPTPGSEPRSGLQEKAEMRTRGRRISVSPPADAARQRQLDGFHHRRRGMRGREILDDVARRAFHAGQSLRLVRAFAKQIGN